ncbi:MAG: hypothetical protein EU529_04255 [Promethearchaeota archaeon]|nr:MAG: hypothetical protein EU529_04255 [Candidatus Lokiarchaeota archaeon]
MKKKNPKIINNKNGEKNFFNTPNPSRINTLTPINVKDKIGYKVIFKKKDSILNLSWRVFSGKIKSKRHAPGRNADPIIKIMALIKLSILISSQLRTVVTNSIGGIKKANNINSIRINLKLSSEMHLNRIKALFLKLDFSVTNKKKPDITVKKPKTIIKEILSSKSLGIKKISDK